MTRTLNVLGLSGSLRAASHNAALLRAADEVAPEGVNLSIYDYSEVPLYNSDVGELPAVEQLKKAIGEADAVILSVAEYNYSISGVLKNALDHASRPAYQSVFRDKPVGVFSAAASFVGGSRAQAHTKTILLGMCSRVFPWPELLVGSAGTKFSDGRLEDEVTRTHLTAYMSGFARWLNK